MIISGHCLHFRSFYGTFTQNVNVLTSSKCLKYNQLSISVVVLQKDRLVLYCIVNLGIMCTDYQIVIYEFVAGRVATSW